MQAEDAAPFTAVAGPGAIGGTLAVSLRRAGERVLLVGRSLARPRRRPGCRAVLLCVKAAGLRWALHATRGLVGPATPVVSLINGVTHVHPVLKAYGPARAVFGVCHIAALRTGTTIRHMGGRDIVLAETPANRAACRQAQTLLGKGGWRVRTVPSVERLLWTKLIHNAAINPLGALTRKTNGQLAAEPALRDLLVRVADEAAAVAKAAGHPSLDANPARSILRGCAAAPRQINSMAQDLAAGRPTEADAILRPLLRAARKAGRATRYLEPLYRMIRHLESSQP